MTAMSVDSSSSSATSGSLDTPEFPSSSAARSSPEYDVRRHAVSMER